MSDETDASFRCTAGKVRKLLKQSALKPGQGDAVHSDVYVQVHPDEVRTIVRKSNNSVLTFCTFDGGYFDDIDVDGEGPVAGIVNVERALNYLAIGEGGTVEVSFMGAGDEELASKIQLDGTINTRWKLPAAEEALERVPQNLPERYDNNERFTGSEGQAHSTFIKTLMKNLGVIKKVVELDNEVDFYPMVVDEGEFRLEVGTDGDVPERTEAWGELEADEVKGDDVSNWYNTGFEEVVDVVGGEVEIELTQDAPMSLVRKESDQTIRHVLAPVQSGN